MRKTTRFGFAGLVAWTTLLIAPAAMAQEAGSITGSPGPGLPFVTEPVLPVPNVRLQTSFIPVDVTPASETVSDFLVPLRFYGAWSFSESVVGEASLPLLLTFPGSSDVDRSTGLDIGNAKIGAEFPIMSENGQMHRLSLSWDMFIPLAQISSGDSTLRLGPSPTDPDITIGTQERDDGAVADAAQRRGRYSAAATLLPNLAPDFLAETFTVMPGLHYRLKQKAFVAHVNLDLPVYLGFDFSQDKFFHQNYFGLRYGVEVSYQARPIYPTVEFTGVTTFSHNDPATLPGAPEDKVDASTALLASLGVRATFGQWEPGVAVTLPLTLGSDADDIFDPIVYIHFELGYRLD